MQRDQLKWNPKLRIDKFSPTQVAALAADLGREPTGAELAGVFEPDEVLHVDGNLLTTVGLDYIGDRLIASAIQAADNTHTRLGVGDSNTAENVAQTDLQALSGSTHRQFKVMDATFPTSVNGVLSFKSTFASGEGNFAWAEWCIDISASSASDGTTVNATMLNRKVAAMGTKVAGAVWTPTVTITLS
jgi:hypothetical protein